MSKKNIAVIGAGASGLPAIKCCLDEGLNPVCLERTDYIGGLWHYTPDIKDGQGCVMKSTVINTSKEMTSYSDFPAPKEYAIYMHNRYVEKYFNLYVDKFNLRKHINFNTEVQSVTKADDYDRTGQWVITTKNIKSNKTETRIFDGVLVCTGHHAERKMPNFKGMDKFKGKIVHSHDYKDHRGYEDKRVVVVGIGNSGGDITVELSRIATQVYLSTRRGAWIFYRVDDQGQAGDVTFNTRFNVFVNTNYPGAINLIKKKLNNRFNHKKYSLEPNHGPLSQHPTVNDELSNRIISGNVIVKPNIREFTETEVIFEDGSRDQIDAVMTATGYIFGFPFLDKSITAVKDNNVNLYKYMFPADLGKNNLAIIGCFQPLGSIMPLSEMQCRLAVRVFKGDVKLPSSSEMKADIRMKQEMISHRYVESTRHTIQVDYIPFMDELAELAGCKPNIGKLMLTDPKLAYQCYFGPCTAYQYRLMGHGAWEGARDAIMTTAYRMDYSLDTRKCNLPEEKRSGFLYAVAIVVLAFIVYIAFTKL